MDQREDERRGTGGRDDGATFEPARLRSAAGPPIAAAWLTLAVVVLVVFGALERLVQLGQPSTAGTSFAVRGPTAAAASASQPALPTYPPGLARVVSRTDGAIKIYAQRNATSTYIHGDVFVPGVASVFLSLQDTSGLVAGWAAASIPAGASPASTRMGSTKPMLQLDVEVAVPASFANGSLWIQANAYDALGRIVDTTRFEVLADGQAGAGATAAPSGFNPRPPPARGSTRSWTRFDE